MSDVFEVFASDVHTAKVPSLGLIDFVRWQTVVDKWPVAVNIPADVRATMREALQIGQRYAENSLAFLNHELDMGGTVVMLRDVEIIEQQLATFDAAFAWLDATQERTP